MENKEDALLREDKEGTPAKSASGLVVQRAQVTGKPRLFF